jgi:hypothetical protein
MGQWTYVGNRKKSKPMVSQCEVWNIRGLNQHGRNIYLEQVIKSNRIDFISIHETKKEDFTLVS